MTKTKVYRIRLSEMQINSLNKLKDNNIKVPEFIRTAIKEKIQRDWPNIKEEYGRIKVPF